MSLRAGSVRARVIAGVMAALTLVLVLLSVAVSAIFTAQSERNLQALLDGRVQLARQLARAGAGPQQIVNRVTTDGVQAHLVLRNGAEFGPPVGAGDQVRSVTATLNGPDTGQPARVDGARLTVSVDASLVRDAQRSLTRVLVLGSLAALLVSAALVAVTVRLALRPLDQVAGLARSITRGQRGSRLRPSRPGTEIGQTAQALDDMLDALEGAEQRARSAERSTRQFLADAAHELRTPLAGVQAAAETLIHQGTEISAEQREQLEVLLVREARRAGVLVGDLLAAARLETGAQPPRLPVPLRRLVDSEVERARLLQPRATVWASGPDLVVPGDPDQLAGVLRNLMDNALRAAGPEGSVSVAVQAAPGWAVVEVLDSGPGIAPADRERIFERLVRLDPDRGSAAGGSGLGLAIARGWARAHGGDLVCSEPPERRGALFRLTLPASPHQSSPQH